MILPRISTRFIPTSAGDLELLACVPQTTFKRPIFCMHGAFCSANDFRNFLRYFASQGYPAYALSHGGHGASWKPSWFRLNVRTSLDDLVGDILTVLGFIRKAHALPPVLVGHSFGGGQLQHLLSCHARLGGSGEYLAAGLVLLASAPITGEGWRIMENWDAAEEGLKCPWSHFQLDTPEQVRASFFHKGTDEATIDEWLQRCRTRHEGMRVSASMLWPFGEPHHVLSALQGLPGTGRKVLGVAATKDRLIPPSMVAENMEAYRASAAGEVVMQTIVPDSAHHLPMDVAWKDCAGRIIDWIQGQ